jgi:hypothetical protein
MAWYCRSFSKGYYRRFPFRFLDSLLLSHFQAILSFLATVVYNLYAFHPPHTFLGPYLYRTTSLL